MGRREPIGKQYLEKGHLVKLAKRRKVKEPTFHEKLIAIAIK